MNDVQVLELHESMKLEFGMVVINNTKKHRSIKEITNNAPIFFNGSFQFLSIDFEIEGRGNEDESWLGVRCFGTEIMQNQCQHDPKTPRPPRGGLYLIYIAKLLIDICGSIAEIFINRDIMAKLKPVAEKDCITINGYPIYMKLIVQKMEANPILLNEVLERTINELLAGVVNL